MAPRLGRKERLTTWVIAALLVLIAFMATGGVALLMKKISESRYGHLPLIPSVVPHDSDPPLH